MLLQYFSMKLKKRTNETPERLELINWNLDLTCSVGRLYSGRKIEGASQGQHETQAKNPQNGL